LSDIRPGEGSMGLSLNMALAAGMANLLSRALGEMNARTIESELVAHGSGLRLLLSTARPKEAALNINPDVAAMILKTLRSMARFVVVDLGTGLSRVSMRVAKDVEQLVMVVEPTRPALTMARETLKELDANGIGRGRTNVVLVNRTQTTVQVPWQEAEQILNHEMVAIITPAPELAFQANEAGFPMVLFQPTAIPSTQMSKIADEIVTRTRTPNLSGTTRP
jgi:MinD-like ATPase involved in chromosome partitioning or flagellar assembly